MKQKFKVGKKYKVCGEVEESGNIIEIIKISTYNKVFYKTIKGRNDGGNYFYIGSMFSNNLKPLDNDETIVIYRKDNETIALDKRTDKKAVAKCSPEDTYNYETGAKLAFNRLMDNNVEEMRKKLKEYCHGRFCCTCKLNGEVCRCGRGSHFFTKKDNGDYDMTYEEIKEAYNVVFGDGKPNKINDVIKVGDSVKVVNINETYRLYVDWVETYVRNGRDLRYKFDYDNIPDMSHNYEVKCVAKHLDINEELAYIEDLSTSRCYVIGVKGLKKC